MADKTAIEWTDATWNPVVGCSIVSKGCTNCYAMKVAQQMERRFGSAKYSGLTKTVNGNPVWTGELRVDESALDQPLRWKRPRRIFVNSMSDLFHENLPDAAIDKVFAVMALAPQHTFQVLTKRAERMRDYMKPFDQRRADALGRLVISLGYKEPLECLRWPLPNVWLGVSVEDQAAADSRIPHLLATPAAKRFLSCEPLLGPVDLANLRPDGIKFTLNAMTGAAEHLLGDKARTAALDWVIAGGESGKNARPMHPDWARGFRDQCADAGVPFFFKQWGEWAPDSVSAAHCDWGDPDNPGEEIHGYAYDETSDSWRVGKKRAGALLDGREHKEFPE